MLTFTIIIRAINRLIYMQLGGQELKKRTCDAIMYNDNNGVICKPIDSNAMQS